MSATSSIQRAKQYMDTLFYKAAEPFLANNALLDDTVSWFGDEPSKKLYLAEITFKIIETLLGKESAIDLCPSGLSRQMWDAAYLEAVARKEEWPAFSFPENEQWPFCTYTTTYLLEQYRYANIVDVEQGDVVFDCGAFILDSAIWALKRGADTVFAFEPNPNTLPHAQHNKALHDPQDRIRIITSGVGDKSGTVAFDGGQGGSSAVASTGELHISVTTLDDFCNAHKVVPSFIKMDVEGFELAALNGARQLLAAHTPKLAICVYHKQEDLWTIPALLKSIVPAYTFYLKKHSRESELVLYATTAE